MANSVKLTLIVFFLYLIPNQARSQGVSFSYLIPTNGYISAPVSPFSLRGIGLEFGDYLGVTTGGTLYYMSGLSMEDLPFANDKPFTGPHFSVLVPAQLYIRLPGKLVETKLYGGGFGLWHMNPRLNYGNIDRAIAEFEGWDVSTANFEQEVDLGGGWMAGIGFEFFVSDDFSLTAEVQYLSGSNKTALTGTYSGGVIGGTISSTDVNYEDASILIEGIEISLGANF